MVTFYVIILAFILVIILMLDLLIVSVYVIVIHQSMIFISYVAEMGFRRYLSSFPEDFSFCQYDSV